MIFLILFYLRENSFERIQKSQNMVRFKDAYIEAFHIMLKNNYFQTLKSEFNVKEILKTAGWEKDYLEQRTAFLKLEGYSELDIKLAER